MGREWEGYGREWEVARDMEKWSPADEDALRKRAECSFCSIYVLEHGSVYCIHLQCCSELH